MPNEEIKIKCPHCSSLVVFTRGETGKWVGRVLGGVGGWWIGSSLGIAGAIFGAPLAIAATIPAIIVGFFAGNKVGNIFDKAICPECDKEIPHP